MGTPSYFRPWLESQCVTFSSVLNQNAQISHEWR